MPDPEGKELARLRRRVAELASNLDRTLNSLDKKTQRQYREAEQSVIDARRKVETREGLFRVG
ncbi:MAG: hypothetical protein ABW196_00865 [Solirubrobacterales bacterium]